MNLPEPWTQNKPTGIIVLSDGTVIEGKGCGTDGVAMAEICFNTAITGYQEILTDPSYAGQIVAFTFPHVGNAGANTEDMEMLPTDENSVVAGAIFKTEITQPSNYRSVVGFEDWLKSRGIIAVCDIDTRALTVLIREKGLVNAVIAQKPDGDFDIDALREQARLWKGLKGINLVPAVTCKVPHQWWEGKWTWNNGYTKGITSQFRVSVMDFGVKKNMLRLLTDSGCKVKVVPASTSAEEILADRPDGVFLSNGPGDPEATGVYAIPVIKKLLKANIPVFGICLGHQILALALGAKTVKMHQGHHGANHPVRDKVTGKVEIVSMNHGFTVDSATLPAGVEETHVSLFDNSNCGLAVRGKPVFSVQYHPEASPGPQDSYYLFKRFIDYMTATQTNAVS